MADGQTTGEGEGREGVAIGIAGTVYKEESGMNENIVCVHMLL